METNDEDVKGVETIYRHEIRIHRKPARRFYNRDEFTIEQVAILAQNDRYVVLGDMHFTKLQKGGDGICWSSINKPNIYFKDCLGEQGIFYTLYATSKKRLQTIEREIRAKADGEYGWLFSDGFDLLKAQKSIEKQKQEQAA